MAMAGGADGVEPDPARQGARGAGAPGVAGRRQALGNRGPGRQPGDHGRHGAPGDRRGRSRSRGQAGQATRPRQRDGAGGPAPHRAGRAVGPEVRRPAGWQGAHRAPRGRSADTGRSSDPAGLEGAGAGPDRYADVRQCQPPGRQDQSGDRQDGRRQRHRHRRAGGGRQGRHGAGPAPAAACQAGRRHRRPGLGQPVRGRLDGGRRLGQGQSGSPGHPGWKMVGQRQHPRRQAARGPHRRRCAADRRHLVRAPGRRPGGTG